MLRRIASASAGRTAGRATGRPFSSQTAKTASRFGFGAMVAGATVTGTTVACLWKSKSVPPPFDYAAVRKDIEDLLDDDIFVGPSLVRLAWHEAGKWDSKAKNGCPNSASMRFAPECNWGANAGLKQARDALEPIKAKHPNLSYADLWSLAACVAIEVMGGKAITWRWGRADARESNCPDGRLPDAAQGANHVRDVFTRLGFNDQETVALIGAHALGECHAENSGFVGPWTHDKVGFNNNFFVELTGNDWLVNKDAKLLQYKDAATGKLMMLPADMALLFDPSYKKWVSAYAQDDDKFQADFAKAFQKLMEVGVADKLQAL